MRLLAKILLSIAAIQYGLIPPIVDFSESHVLHPDWPAHARFHLVWLLALSSAISIYVLLTIWTRSSHNWLEIRQASIVGCIVLAGFFAAAIMRVSYGGSLTDLAEPILVFGVDGNLFSFSVAAVFQLVGTAIVWRVNAVSSKYHNP